MAGQDSPPSHQDEEAKAHLSQEEIRAALREVPQVDQILRSLAETEDLGGKPREILARQVRRVLDVLKGRIFSGFMDAAQVKAWFEEGRLLEEVRKGLERPAYHARVLNATGVVLHTGLGRAPLAREARETLQSCAGYCRLEVDPLTGERSRREDAVRELLVRITGAESALVVNNNAAATLLALNSLAAGGEVPVSRAEMVEIGGSYRMPEVMRYAGCKLVDVGCTNKTYLRDYRAACNERTALLLKVHTSNYRIHGFTETTSLEELCSLGRELEIPVMEDLGSGQLWPEPIPGLEDEPLVKDSVAAGADLVCFSGDKLLGGPQAGIIVGSKEAVEKCRRNPLYRAVRCDKLALSALEATLAVYDSGEEVSWRIPALRFLMAPLEELRRKARRLKGYIDRKKIPGLETCLMDGTSRAGSGSAPDRELPTRLVGLKGSMSAEKFLRRLRAAPIPLFARVREEMVLLDPRTLEEEEIPLAADSVEWALGDLPAGD